jgi:serine/threonine protein phosphatase PrpC
VASATDPGRRRDHNEDNCYPDPNEQTIIMDGLQNCVAIVCDGLGGHEGGEVASRMAISSLCAQLEPLLNQIEKGAVPYDPVQFSRQLEEIVKRANDGIVELNDQQQRTAQRRMGTTLVMTVLPRPNGKPTHEIYVVHVGDSRIYWITPESCRQITLDDDVATRETTLGLNFYSYSSQRVDAGALIQALGTRSSDVLVPRVQRFLLDEECLLLLCSDGLSDYDRVEEMFVSHVRPILTDRLSLSASCQNLIAQGNFLNGHDNITVVLMRCQSAPYEEVDVAVQQRIARSRKFATTKATAPKPEEGDRTQFITNDGNTSKTTIQTVTKVQPKPASDAPTKVAVTKSTDGEGKGAYFLWGIIFLASGFAIGALVIFNVPFLQRLLRPAPSAPSPSPSPMQSPSPSPPMSNDSDRDVR